MRGQEASEEGRGYSLPAATYPGDAEGHGFLFTRQQLGEEGQSAGAPTRRVPEPTTDLQPFLRSTPGGAGSASSLNPAPLPPYWSVRGTRSLPIGAASSSENAFPGRSRDDVKRGRGQSEAAVP